ncbi:NAD(P)-binding protein [Amylocystis lapponica]|nr:NAD(P)-binding protein [Amylocystis lapponica]
MHLLILGGTGAAGVLLVQEALAASHTVAIYARSPTKLPDTITANPSATVIEGTLTDDDSLFAATEGVDAVLSCLGPTSASHPADTPIAHGYTHVIAAMKKRGVRRLIACGTASMVDERDRFSFTFTAMVAVVALLIRNAYKDVVATGKTIRAQGDELDWTIVRVPMLNDKENRAVVAGYIGDAKVGVKLARIGFAVFVLQELEQNVWIRKVPMISSA